MAHLGILLRRRLGFAALGAFSALARVFFWVALSTATFNLAFPGHQSDESSCDNQAQKGFTTMKTAEAIATENSHRCGTGRDSRLRMPPPLRFLTDSCREKNVKIELSLFTQSIARRSLVKKLMLWTIALIALAASALHAQNITGAWQGSLKPGPQELRIVIKISLEDDKLKAVTYSIDQGAQPIPASAITQSGSIIKMTVAAIGGSYEGRLSADGNSMTGTWSQGVPLPLNLTRATPETAWTIPEPPPPPKLMAAEATPAFEVATIKPSRSDERFSLLVNRSGLLNTTSTSLSDLIKFAYDLHPRQITGGPTWLEAEKYDVTGKPDTPGLPSIKQLKGMVRQLLAERFALTFHHDEKELSVYAITIAKTGAKLTRNESNPNGLPGFGGGGPRGLNVRNATMAEFASMLQANIVDRPVVDQTGLGAARYDFILKHSCPKQVLAV